LSDSEKSMRKSSHFDHPKQSSKKTSPSESAIAQIVKNKRVSFVEVLPKSPTEVDSSSLQPSIQNLSTNEDSNIASMHHRHPSLIAKFGALNVFKPSSGKLSPRWCNLSAVKFRIFSRNNQSDLKLSIDCSDIERVDDFVSSQDIVLYPIVITLRKSNNRQRPLILSASSSQEQHDWIAVSSRGKRFTIFYSHSISESSSAHKFADATGRNSLSIQSSQRAGKIGCSRKNLARVSTQLLNFKRDFLNFKLILMSWN